MSGEKAIGKWDWIAEKCKELQYPSTANVAEFMATCEEQVYPGKMSWYWKTHMKTINIMFAITKDPVSLLVVVAEFPEFKVGCLRHGDQCADCEFGKKYGKCGDSGSIEHFWKYVLQKDYGRELDEKNVLRLQTRFEEYFGQ